MAAVLLPIWPNAEDLWQTALANLSDEDKSALALGGTGMNRLDAITQSLKLADDAAMKCKDIAWRFKRKNGGEVISAGDVFANTARWINHFKDLVDTVQYNPVYAALPWAGVRFVLQVCVSYFETHDCLLEKVAHVTTQICRYAVIEMRFIRPSLPILVDELRRALVKLYAAILTFLSQVKAYFQQTTREQVLKSLKHVSTRFNGAFQATITAQTNVQASLRSKRTKILQWMWSKPYLQHHKRERETFLEGTGNWLISHPIFQKWKDESASSLLWLHGIPGSGKSKLTSLVIEDAIEAFRKQQAPPPAYFYCSRNPAEPERSDPEMILASIFQQFSSSGPGKPLLPPTVTTYQSHENEGFSSDGLQVQDSYKLLLESLSTYPTAKIIIDALDECHPQTRQGLLDKLVDILHESPTLVKIFVSSRDDHDITYKLRDYPALELSSDLNSVDIRRFVNCKTQLLSRQGRLLPFSHRAYETSETIIQEVCRGAHGMFRWAELQLEALCDLVTEKEILERLGRLPRALKDLYQEILDQVQQSSVESERVYAKNALVWLLCSRERLSSEQFLTAISTTVRPTKSLSIDYVLKVCRNLVSGNFLRFSQHTVSLR
ncbi:hypothetical protein GGS24DRAFT_173997 [Hypoxylon argillaceum]|nr:hypothetical protein GGS24DRAFT_173997 [Hypoxylon argillaceum]